MLDGQEVSGLSADERALLRNQKIGFVFQNFNLLPRTSALENVILPLIYTQWSLSPTVKPRRRAMELIKRVGLGDRATSRAIAAVGRAAAAGGHRAGAGQPAVAAVCRRADRQP